MNYLVIVLRLIHVFSGVFWVGSALLMAGFITPAVAATADAGQKFMFHLATKSRFTIAMTSSAVLTVLAGAWLYWINSGGLTSGWTGSATGWGFSIGAIFGIIGFVFGALVGKTIGTLGKITSQVQGKPTSDQMSQIQIAQKQLNTFTILDTIPLILALICMATARYW